MPHFIFAAFSVITLGLGGPATAATCFQKSPDFLAQGEQYYEINSLQVSDKQKRNLDSFLKEVKGKWSLEMVETKCRGNEINPRSEVRRYHGISQVSSSRSYRLKIKLEKENREGRGVEKMDLLAMKSLYKLYISKTSIIAGQKYRRKTNGGVTLVDIVYELKRSSEMLELQAKYYSNGYFYRAHSIVFTRR